LYKASIQSLTINADDWSTFRALHTARDLYIPLNVELTSANHVELTRRFAVGYKAALAKDPENIIALRKNIENYQMRLDMLGLTDKDVVKNKKWGTRLGETMLFNMMILWPFALIGSTLNLPIAIFSKIMGKILARGEIVEEATYKMMSALLAFIILYTTVPIVVGYLLGRYWALFAVVFLALSGYAAVNVRPLGSSIAFAKSLLKLVPKDLKDEREKLRQQLQQAMEVFYDGPRMFPQLQ